MEFSAQVVRLKRFTHDLHQLEVSSEKTERILLEAKKAVSCSIETALHNLKTTENERELFSEKSL